MIKRDDFNRIDLIALRQAIEDDPYMRGQPDLPDTDEPAVSTTSLATALTAIANAEQLHRIASELENLTDTLDSMSRHLVAILPLTPPAL